MTKFLKNTQDPLMQRIQYDKKGQGEIIVTNLSEAEGYSGYPDLTEHCIYLIRTLYATLEEATPGELIFLQRYH